jgi:hypothetical protein
MIEIRTELPDDAKLFWSNNGHVSWLEDEDGIQYRPPQWVYRLVDEARREGRNEVRRQIGEALRLEASRGSATSPHMLQPTGG